MLRMILVLFCYGAGTLLGLGSAVWASCFFIWSEIFRPAAFARNHSILGSSLWMPVHLITAVLLLSIVLKPWKRRWNGAATAILIFAGWIFVSALASKFRIVAMAKAIETSKYLIPLAIISATLCTRKAQKLFFFTLAASVGAWLVHHGMITVMSGSAQIDMAIPGGQMSDRNDFMVAGTACIPMLAYIGWSYAGPHAKWLRPALKFGTLFAVGALFYSLSRGAFLGFSALLCWYGILTGRFFKRLPLVLALGVVIALMLPQVVIERMTTMKIGERQTDASAINRLEHMKTAVEVTLDFPLTGVGPAVFPYASQRYSAFGAEPHSLWLKCSAELGLPMLIFFLMLVCRLLWRLHKVAASARLRGDKDTEHFSTALSCALVGFLATGTFTSQFMSEYMWAIIGLIGAFLATPIEQATELEADGAETDAAAQPALAAGSASS